MDILIKPARILFLFLMLISGNATATKAIKLVVNYQADEVGLSESQIRNLYMGGQLNIDLTPVNLPPGNLSRIVFNTKMIGLTEARIQSYWAQMRFSGRKKPPIEIKDEKKLIEYLEANKNCIAYLPINAAIPEHFTVIKQF